MDTRVPGAASAAESEVASHLARHALDPALVELARPLLREVLARHPSGSLWISLSWEDSLARLYLRDLPDEALPGHPLWPGFTQAHREAPSLWARQDLGEVLTVELGVARSPEGDLDPGPSDPALVPTGNPAALVGLIAASPWPELSLEERAAGAGATLAVRQLSGSSPPGDAVTVAEAIIAAEAEIGGDFRLVTSSDTRAVIANHRCPFGPTPPPGLCRFTSALAGTMAARLAGRAEVALDERLALGDAQCRMVVDLGSNSDRLTSHHYTWPAAGLPEVEDPLSGATTRGFRVTLTMLLPRDRLSVPVTRHLVRAALEEVGVVPEDVEAVELAITEGCTNVIDHSGPGDAYQVSVTLGPTACHIRVVDIGRGFDHRALSPPEMADLDAEHGRGVALMHALVDQVRFESEPEQGTVVHLVKVLHFDDEVPARRLMLAGLEDQSEA